MNTHNNISSSKLQYKHLITNYLNKNIDQIINISIKDGLSTYSLYQDSCRINLYIQCSEDVGHDISNTKLLICIQYHHTDILEHYEIEALKYVTKLLSSLRVKTSN